MSHPRRFRPLLILAALFLLLPQIIGAATVPQALPSVRGASTRAAATAARPATRAKIKQHPNTKSSMGGGGGEEEEDQDLPLERDDAFYSRRTAGDQQLTVPEAGVFRAQAAAAVGALKAR